MNDSSAEARVNDSQQDKGSQSDASPHSGGGSQQQRDSKQQSDSISHGDSKQQSAVRRIKRRTRRIIIGGVLGVIGVLLLAVWFAQRSFYYYPDTSKPGTVSDRAEGGTDVVLETSDGLKLDAWRLDPVESGEASSAGRAVLFFPGNGGNRLTRLELGEEIRDKGFTVLLVDYRGYGGNPGSPSEDGLQLDAQAAVEYLAGSGFGPENLIVMGESIGTGVAVGIAEKVNPAGLFLRSPLTSLDDVAGDQVGFPVGWFLRDHFRNIDRIPNVSSKVLVLAGSADELVDPAQSKRVADGARNLVGFEQVDGANHNDDIWYGPFVADQVARLAAAL